MSSGSTQLVRELVEKRNGCREHIVHYSEVRFTSRRLSPHVFTRICQHIDSVVPTLLSALSTIVYPDTVGSIGYGTLISPPPPTLLPAPPFPPPHGNVYCRYSWLIRPSYVGVLYTA